jgi:hypothetical protein
MKKTMNKEASRATSFFKQARYYKPLFSAVFWYYKPLFLLNIGITNLFFTLSGN